MRYLEAILNSLTLIAVILFAQCSARTAGETANITATPAALQFQTITRRAASGQSDGKGTAVAKHPSEAPQQDSERAEKKVASLIRLYIGLWRFALLILLCSGGVMPLPLGVGYLKQRKDQGAATFSNYAYKALGRYRWWLWLLIVTDVFLLSNHLLARGQAFGLWDVNGAYCPYQILVADFARARHRNSSRFIGIAIENRLRVNSTYGVDQQSDKCP